MIPTIDFSNLGLLVAIGGAIKYIVGFLVSSAEFVANKVVAFVAGSKIWATAFFLTISLVVVGFFMNIISGVASRLLGLALNDIRVRGFDWEMGVVGEVVPIQDVFDALVWCVGIVLDVFVVERNLAIYRIAVEKFRTIVASWKT